MFRKMAEKVGLVLAAAFIASPATAISFELTDDFEDGTTQGWGPDFAGSIFNETNAGPLGAGDDALLIASTGVARQGSRSIAINTTQWTGDWTAAGVDTIEFDAKNGNDFEIVLWLGIAGPGRAGSAGSGDTYVSLNSATLAPNADWTHFSFDVSAAGFENATNHSSGTLLGALSDVSQLRIFHNINDRSDLDNPNNFVGDVIDADVYIDNITAVPEPAWVATAAGLAALLRRHRLE